jgi:hypothetical protein
MDDLALQATKVNLNLAHRDRCPLDFWTHASEQSREATKLALEYDELYARAANKAGKSEWAAAFVLACLQKRSNLDCVTIPTWRGAVTALALSLDYTQQKLSVQQTLLRLLGSWPYKAHWKGDGILSSLRVMPLNGGADESQWSTLTLISEDNPRAGLGARADIVWADEPPVESIWREARKAAHAGRRSVRIISATPTLRRQWEWLRNEYGECPRGQIRRHDRWAEIRWSLHDNHALSAQEVAALEADFRTDPLADARIHGDYVDAAGSCPFNISALLAMLAECREPELVEWKIQREENTPEGWAKVISTVEVEVYDEPRQGLAYYVPVDPSAGIADTKHDPGAIHIREIGTGNLVARYVGYCGGFGLGVLSAALARQYNHATVDPESTGGWIEGVLAGLRASDYGNIAHEQRQEREEFRVESGFRTTHQSRNAMIGEIQTWIDSYAAGVKYANCPSRGVIQCLLDCVMDENGKVLAAPGYHDEDLILWGQGLRRAVAPWGRNAPAVYRPTASPDDKLARLIRGEDDDDDEDTEPSHHNYRNGLQRPRI